MRIPIVTYPPVPDPARTHVGWRQNERVGQSIKEQGNCALLPSWRLPIAPGNKTNAGYLTQFASTR